MRAKITGPLADPQVKMNPLSALTPGVLRGLFGLGAKVAAQSRYAQSQQEAQDFTP